MNKTILIFGIILSALMISSCVKDLDVAPQDPTKILAGNLGDDPAYMDQALAKIYASFIISGQGANGGDDIAASDGNFFTTMRALWNLQEITTDEAICAWGDVGIADLNTQTWSPTNPFLTALYQRLALSITYANDFINNAQQYGTENVERYVAEARFLRALAYYWAIDLFGQFPFTTEEDGVGKFFPKIGSRQEIFAYIESELLDIENKLGAPRFSYPQADQAAAWMLLSRLYLNAQVYTGTPRWNDVVTYTGKVIGAGYSLASDYSQNFSADNDGRHNPEMIFAWEQDG
ncbi:MAG TPA: RagB/SusD family nutrient uptake outer membrane protein, partial [Bacteroidales bacterium]|nr:RagB/SusD family nutrient uptake outer membrane protein [Bacteroidales bacterium]